MRADFFLWSIIQLKLASNFMSTNNWEEISSIRLGKTYCSSDNKFLFIKPMPPISNERLALSWHDVNQEEAQIIALPELGEGVLVPHHHPVTRLSTNDYINHLLSTYERTGRILFDANLDLYKDASGRIYANNVFLALNISQKHFEIDKTDRELYESIVKTSTFSKSDLNYFKLTLKSLVFISLNRPDLNNLHLLYNNIPAILKISYGFETKDLEQINAALQELQIYHPESDELRLFKNSCIEILNTYKASKEKELSFNPAKTKRKIKSMDELIVNIQNAHFIEDIIHFLQSVIRQNRNLVINHTSFFRQVVKECLEIPLLLENFAIYKLKEDCIELLESYQQSKKKLAWAKSMYSYSQNKIFVLDGLIDMILQSRTAEEILLSLNNFKEENKALFKIQTGELMQSLEKCDGMIQEYIEKQKPTLDSTSILGEK
jgi:hypothetical protein